MVKAGEDVNWDDYQDLLREVREGINEEWGLNDAEDEDAAPTEMGEADRGDEEDEVAADIPIEPSKPDLANLTIIESNLEKRPPIKSLIPPSYLWKPPARRLLSRG